MGVSAVIAWLGLLPLLAQPIIDFSPQRWFLLLLQLFLCGLLSWQMLRLARDKPCVRSLATRLQAWHQRRKIFYSICILATLGVIFSWTGLFLPETRAVALLGNLALYLPRLVSLFALGLSLGLFSLLVALIARYGWKSAGSEARLGWRSSAILLALLLILWAVISLSGLGLGFDKSEWNAPGAPVLISQVFSSLVIAVLARALVARLPFRRRTDLLLFLLIWIIAALIWNAIPTAPTYYSSAPLPPVGQSFPVSDAFNHDVIANNLLIGEGLRFGSLEAVRKPLYAGFLGLLHLGAGSDYDALVVLQVIILALFPAIFFLLGRELHSRFAGLALAALIIFREANSLRLGDVINLSHAKLLMADFLAALGLALFALLAVIWIKRHRAQAHWALLLGGLLGLLLLLRSQHLTVIGAFAIFLLLAARAWKWNWKQALLLVLIFALGVSLAAMPWLLRNHDRTGQWIIEHSTAVSYLAQRYSDDPEFSREFLPGEGEGEYYARFSAQLRDSLRADPMGFARIATDNYVRNLLLTITPLPLTLQLWDLEEHVRQQNLWPSWDGSLSSEAVALMAVNLAVLSLGIAAAWQRWRWAGLVPLAVLLGFTLNLAVARVSGWRYNQPVDWIVLLYFVIGLSQGLHWLGARLSLVVPTDVTSENKAPRALSFQPRPLIVSALTLVLLGSSLLIVERAIPPRYSGQLAAQVQPLFSTFSRYEAYETLNLLTSNQLRKYEGRVLYPRFLKAGQGEAGGDFVLTSERDYSRLTFYLVGPEPLSVVLPINAVQDTWASGMDAVVLTCKGANQEVLAVLLFDQTGNLIQSYYSMNAIACSE